MRFLLLLLFLACGACSRGAKLPHASGRLVFDTKPANEAGVFLATEAEVLRSSRVLQRIKDEFRIDVDPRSISVTRHTDTMILDISVADRDPRVAAETCNDLLRVYLEERLQMAVMPIQERMELLSQKLDETPNDEDLKRQLKELDIQQHLRLNDVHVLEACMVPVKK